MTILASAYNIEYDLQSFIEYQTRIDSLLDRLSKHTNAVTHDPCSFVGLSFDERAIDIVLNMVKAIGLIDGVVVVGIGGSNLASRALESALFGLFNFQKKVPIWWADTVDQFYLDGIISCAKDLFAQKKRLVLIVVSKSGTTFETRINADVLISLFKQHYKSDYSHHIIYGSDDDSPLAHEAYAIKAHFVSIPHSVGGRFSAFSMPHLLILALAGIDIQLLCHGATAITPILLESSLKNPALFRAIGLYECYQKNIRIHDIFMPGILLNELGNWMRQLIGESLGKKHDINGEVIHAGFTPTVSICSIDLHSVGQLYVEGPSDRVTSFLSITSNNIYIRNKDFFQDKYSQFMQVSMNAITEVYKDLKKPYFCISIPEKNTYYLGQLMQMMMIEVVLLACLMNINPFDQPGVELFKRHLKK